jgi:predicted ATPase
VSSAALSAFSSQRPLLLILEDLHWLDSASGSLLVHLSREASRNRMLILGTYRPDELAVRRGEIAHPLVDILSELKRWHGDIWLDLGELAEADGRRFVEAYLDTQPNRPGLSRGTHPYCARATALLDRFQRHAAIAASAARRSMKQAILASVQSVCW